MDLVINQTLSDGEITLDGKHFQNCTFTRCKLNFSGGLVTWDETHFIDCTFSLWDAAARTAQILETFGQSPSAARPTSMKLAPAPNPRTNKIQ